MTDNRRYRRGESHPHSKMTEKKVRKLRSLIALREDLLRDAEKLSDDALALEFGISARQVRKIKTGQAWAGVE